ncbi:hypothetical protein ACNVED_10975 [Legionella sp. D16C41]|uniref:hypothetical protein n=1 Tax=Legionella sp. D16C41 TaxID=3402688 RepID=UPI003AF4F236
MEFLDTADKIIPGYSLLSLDDQHAFHATTVGQNFVNLIAKINHKAATFQSSITLLNMLFSSLEIQKEKLLQEIEKLVYEFTETFKEHETYKLVKEKCDFLLLAEDCYKLHFVQEENRKLITTKDYSKAYIQQKTLLEKALTAARNEFATTRTWPNEARITKLNQQCLNAKTSWLEHFHNDAELTELRNNIAQEEIRENLSRLAHYFNLFNYRLKPTSIKIELDNLIAAVNLSNKMPETIAKLKYEHLSNIIYYCMDKVSMLDIQFIDLQQFNKEQANLLTTAILEAFANDLALNLHELLNHYHLSLKQYINKQLLLINGKNLERDTLPQPPNLLNSLSYLLSNPLLNQTNEFLRRLSDAHAFIQATGFATQNESSFLAIFDFYNYNRFAGQVAEAKSILSSLFNPFLPLYSEYKEVALYEKSFFWKLYRTVMPVIIAVSFIVLIAALLSPLGLPELAFAAVFLPTLFIGVALATKYVQVKDKLYNALREMYYEGSYEIPEFQINERMLAAFGKASTAYIVKNYYIKTIQACIEIDKFYQAKKEKGLLTSEEIQAQKDNTTKLNLLYLEWYDIHSNRELSYTVVSSIILTRLKAESNKEYKALKAAFEKESTIINQTIDKAVEDLEVTLSGEESLSRPKNTNAKATVPTLKIHYTPKLFKPRCLLNKIKTEEYANLINLIQPK